MEFVSRENGGFDIKIYYTPLYRCRINNIYIMKEYEKANLHSYFSDVQILQNSLFTSDNINLKNEIIEIFKDYLKECYLAYDVYAPIFDAEDIDVFSARIGNVCGFSNTEKRTLLFEIDPIKRLEKLKEFLQYRVYEVVTEKESSNLVDFYKRKLIEYNFPKSVRDKAFQMLYRLKTVPANEKGRCLNWLNEFFLLPWNKYTEDNKDVNLAKDILNSSHYGLDVVKQKVIDYISIKNITGISPTSIICLYGPPGVGKTSIVKSIAKALNKNYATIPLGGVTDPQDLTGISHFYVGAVSGLIYNSIKKTGSKNCIILLDEIDKIGRESHRGDPSSVLLRLLDREQNNEFSDSFFDVPFDFSQIFFIATANDLNNIPLPLKNRMEIIEISGYSTDEKIHIAQNYILPKTLTKFGFGNDILKISEQNMYDIISQYTFESGVRDLEKILEQICKKYIIEHNGIKKQTILSATKIRNYIGDEYYKETSEIAQKGEIGVINKLSVLGNITGNVNRLEISMVKGKGDIIISSNLKGTAKDSFIIAIGLIKANCKKWNIDETIFENHNFYIHSPHLEILHSGSSGGLADVLCILSVIKSQPIDCSYAFTGEISLKGNILTVGGLKEKLLAAEKNGIKNIVIPYGNKKEVEKLHTTLFPGLNIVYIKNINEAYDIFFDV